MIIDETLERLYQQVELVKGAGDPRTGKLCVMSFVAYLAGEGHSDRPATASPLIRELAVRINDAMPATMRQELKPFVPRIIGTNDGHDAERATALRDITEREILPRICADFLAKGALRGWRRTTEFRELSSRLFDLTHARDIDVDSAARCKLAAAVASLLCFCATEAPDPVARPWYWRKAIELLDRACDVGAERGEPTIDTGRVQKLEEMLGRRERIRGAKAMTDRAVGRLRAVLTWPAKAL
ncbi:MAG TPA: hypothetical protein VG848_04950 [Acetobacteraceae bacterium]|jgi:hypothetical protein|nr:hypothetical protein [Acetobacteraceae bacterium]